MRRNEPLGSCLSEKSLSPQNKYTQSLNPQSNAPKNNPPGNK